MLLAIDTATSSASLAVYDLNTATLLAEMTWQARRRQTQDLLVTAQHLLGMVDLAARDLTALAVTTGPGSFTGVRIGISTVKGIGLGLPALPQVVGIPTLTVTAAGWLEAAAACSPVAIACACIQAGRGRYNWTFFGPDDLLWRPQIADHHAGGVDDFARVLADHTAAAIWLVGEVDAALQAAVQTLAHVYVADATSALRRASQLARLAALFLGQGVADDLQTLQPLYLRNP